METSRSVETVLQSLGHKPLSKTWAKIEISLGLAGMFIGITWSLPVCIAVRGLPSPSTPDFPAFLGGLALFVLGGYLALAGHRSHIYQSMNHSTALLVREIRRRDGEDRE